MPTWFPHVKEEPVLTSNDALAMTTFIRVLEAEDKAAALVSAVEEGRTGSRAANVFKVPPESFAQMPGSPFAYWVSENVRSLWGKMPNLISLGLPVQHGMATKNDIRFLRFWVEANPEMVGRTRRWVLYAKGGTFAHYFSDIHLLVDWKQSGQAIHEYLLGRYPYLKGSSAWILHPECNYYSSGVTYSRRTQKGFSVRALPADCRFDKNGPAITHEDPRYLLTLLGLLNSSVFRGLLELVVAFGSYETGVVGAIPVPSKLKQTDQKLSELAEILLKEIRNSSFSDEISHAFVLPVLVNLGHGSLASCVEEYKRIVNASSSRVRDAQTQINEQVSGLYGLSPEDLAALTNERSCQESSLGADHLDAEDGDVNEDEPSAIRTTEFLVAEIVSWLVGTAFGRWDVRLATGARKVPLEPGPFDPLPTCSPGMLTDSHGLPTQCPSAGYPILSPEDGILVDDPGMGGVPADRDIVRRLRQVIELVWGEKTSDIEQELCALLGVRELRDYVCRPALFFDAHLKRYSKSRRKAPIYWPLSTASGSYTVWVYYPRLTADTLYKIVTEQLGPKIGKVEDRIAQVEGEEAKRESREGARAAKELGELSELLAELKELREELLRIAKLPYKPDLNDGVQITAAPLWRLFRLPRWRAELEKTWKALERGDYDWAHLAYAIWPDRVKVKCKTDKSLAIAHGLETFYEEPVGTETKREARPGKAKQTGDKQKKAARGKR